MSSHWVLFADAQVEGAASVTEVPKGLNLNEWLAGEGMNIPEGEEIQALLSSGSGDFRGDLMAGVLPLFHEDFLDTLKEFGIDDIQSQSVELKDQNTGELEHGYYMANIPSLIKCIKNYDLKSSSHLEPELFEVDNEKTQGLHIFRPVENPKLIVISQELNEFLTSKEVVAVRTIPTVEYLKSSNLSPKEIELSKELTTLVLQRSYTDETFDKVEALITAGASPEFIDSEDWAAKPALVEALSSWNPENRRKMLKLLIKFGAIVNREFDGKYAIIYAARNGDLNDVNLLLEHGAIGGYEDALKEAIEQDALDIVKVFTERGTDLNNPPALSSCSETYRLKFKEGSDKPIPGIEIAQYLISKCASVNGEDSHKGDPLISAISKNFLELVELLIRHGASIPQTDDGILQRAQTPEMIDLLVKLGADPLQTFGGSNETYLMASIFWGDKDLFDTYLKHGIDLYETDNDGDLAFHYALRGERKNIIEYLLTLYDLKKVDEIKGVLGVADNPGIESLLKEKLGLVDSQVGKSNQARRTGENNPEFQKIKKMQSQYRANVFSVREVALKALPGLDENYSTEISEKLVEEMRANIANWATTLGSESNEAPQAFVLEYAGSATEPFDAGAMFYGYEICNESEESGKLVWNLDKPVDTLNEAFVSLNYYFDGIEALLTDYPELSDNICKYYGCQAFMQFHHVLDGLVEEGQFSKFSAEKPILIFGREHDQDPVLIYRIDSI